MRATYLMCIHAASSAVAPFNRRCIGDSVVQLIQDTLNATHRAVNVTNINFDHALAFPMLDDLYVSPHPRNTVAHVRKAPAVPLTAGALDLPENPWEQAGVAGFTIGERDQLMPIGKALGRIVQHTPNERLIALPVHL